LGFPLNSGIDYFRLDPDHANALAPGKRPRTTVTPTLVCKDGKPYFAIGASNGDGEPQTLAQCLVNMIDYEMDIQEATNAPMWRSSWLYRLHLLPLLLTLEC
jgi:gamma-glutamyltranspeptidase/glutathione hydrolase